MSDPRRKYAHHGREDADRSLGHDETSVHDDHADTSGFEPADALERALQASVLGLSDEVGGDRDGDDANDAGDAGRERSAQSEQHPAPPTHPAPPAPPAPPAHAPPARAATAPAEEPDPEDEDVEPFRWQPPQRAAREHSPAQDEEAILGADDGATGDDDAPAEHIPSWGESAEHVPSWGESAEPIPSWGKSGGGLPTDAAPTAIADSDAAGAAGDDDDDDEPERAGGVDVHRDAADAAAGPPHAAGFHSDPSGRAARASAVDPAEAVDPFTRALLAELGVGAELGADADSAGSGRRRGVAGTEAGVAGTERHPHDIASAPAAEDAEANPAGGAAGPGDAHLDDARPVEATRHTAGDAGDAGDAARRAHEEAASPRHPWLRRPSDPVADADAAGAQAAADATGAELSGAAHGTLVRRDAAVADPAAAAAADAADADDEAWGLDAAIGAVVASHGTAVAAPSASASGEGPRRASRTRGFEDEVAKSFSRRPPGPGALLRAPADVAPRMERAAALAHDGDPGDPAASAEAAPVRKAGPRPSRLPGQLDRRATIPEFHFDKPSAYTADAPTRPSSADDDPFAPALFGEPLDWSGAKKRHRRADAAPPSTRPARADAAGAPPADGYAEEAGGHGDAGEAGGHGYGDPAEVDADWNLDAEIAAIATSRVTVEHGGEPADDGRPPPALAQHADAVTKHSHQRRRAFLIGGGILALAVLGTVGLVGYGALGGGGGGDGEPLIVRADPDGLKVFPDSDDAADADLAFDGRFADFDPEDGELVITERPEIGIDPAPVEPGSEEDVLRSRLVRTVVVRPDGTIVRGGAGETDTGASDAGVAGAPRTVGGPAETASDAGPGSAAADDEVARLLAAAATDFEGADAGADGDATPVAAAGGDPAGDASASPTAAADPDADVETANTAGNATLDSPDVALDVPLPRARPTPPPRRAPAQPEPIAAPAAAAPQSTGQASLDAAGEAAGETAVASNSDPGLTVAAETPSAIPPAAAEDGGATATASAPPAARAAGPETGLVRPQNSSFLDRAFGLKTQPEPPRRTLVNPGPVSPNVSNTTAELLPWAVQIASQRSAQEAQRSYQAMQERFPQIIGNRPPVIRKVDLGGRGTFYRVRIPTGSREEARNICAQLKAAGGECFVGPADSS